MPVRRTGMALVACLALGLVGCADTTETTTADKPSSAAASQAAAGSASSPAVEASSSASGAASDDASPTEKPSVDLGTATASTTAVASPTVALKKAATAKLPTTLAGLDGKVEPMEGNKTIGYYTGKTEDEMVVATLTIGQQKAAALTQLTEPTTEGHVTCGKLASTGLAGCYLWLDGGNVEVYGTNHTTVDELRKVANSLYEQLG